MKKTSNGNLIKNPTQFEIMGLQGLCEGLDCTMSELIDCIMSNVVTEEISIQLSYNRTGCHPTQQEEGEKCNSNK